MRRRPVFPRSLLRTLILALGLAGLAHGLSPGEGCQGLCGLLPESPRVLGCFLDCLNAMEGWVGREIPDWVVHSQPLSYTARKPRYDPMGKPLLDSRGEYLCDPVRLSGRVFFPPAWRVRSLRPLPLVVFTHGTGLRKDAVASNFSGHEWVFGAAAAVYYGFAVVMPDLPGMGGDSGAYHPYCHRRSLAYAVVDALPAVRRMLREDRYLLDNPYRWDDRLFLMGYSEGGYASLAAARELESRPERYRAESGFTLAGTACMGAPYDLSGTMRRAFLAEDEPCPHSFFLPLLVLGYHGVYGRLIDPQEIFEPVLLERRKDGDVLQWADGGMEGLHVDVALARRLGAAAGQVVLRSLFRPAWAAGVLDAPDFPATPLGEILRENDLLDGWAPTRPILFGHSPDDRDVPIQNAHHAMAACAEAIRREGRDPAGLLELKLLGAPGKGVSHAAACAPGIVLAFRWIEERRGARVQGAGLGPG